MSKRIPVKKNIPVKADQPAEEVKVKQVRPQPTIVAYGANPNPPAEHTTLRPGETLEQAEQSKQAVRDAIQSRTLEDLRKEDNGLRIQKPAGEPAPTWAKIIAAPFIVLAFLLVAALMIGAIAIIVWFIGWAFFGAW